MTNFSQEVIRRENYRAISGIGDKEIPLICDLFWGRWLKMAGKSPRCKMVVKISVRIKRKEKKKWRALTSSL